LLDHALEAEATRSVRVGDLGRRLADLPISVNVDLALGEKGYTSGSTVQVAARRPPAPSELAGVSPRRTVRAARKSLPRIFGAARLRDPGTREP
jgi:hypothetical protein